jgi:hypothetical protein
MCPRTRPFPLNLQRPLDPTDKPAAAGLDRLVDIFAYNQSERDIIHTQDM